MRPIVAVAAVSLCLWYGIVCGVVAATDEFAPNLIPVAKHRLVATFDIAKTHVRTRIAYYRSKFRIPA